MDFLSIENYGRGENGRVFTINAPNGSTLKVWYSYQTPVAFAFNGSGRVVRVNSWGPTTGGHLASIDGGEKLAKAQRIDSDAFERRLQAVVEEFTSGRHDVTRERLAALGEETLRQLRERGQTVPTQAGLSRHLDGMARDGFHALGAYARAQGFFAPQTAEVDS